MTLTRSDLTIPEKQIGEPPIVLGPIIAIEPAGLEHAARLADLHARSFSKGWSAADLRELLGMPGMMAWLMRGAETMNDLGFILVSCVGDEAEVVTIAVAPAERGSGLGTRLLGEALARARALGAKSVFLEVEEGNAAAFALYRRFGFSICGRRRGYYRDDHGVARDALVMTLDMVEGPSRSSVASAGVGYR